MTDTQNSSLQPNTESPIDYAALGKSISQSSAPQEPPPETPPEPKAEAPKEEPKPTEGEKSKTEEAPKAESGMNIEVQKLAQRISSIDSRFEKLMEKIEAKGEATAEDAAKAKALQKEKDDVASKLKGIAKKGDDDITTADVRELAQDSDSFQTQMKETLERVQSENRETRELLGKLQAQQAWEAQTKAYPEINHKEVWDKATRDAAEQIVEEVDGLGLTDEKIESLTYRRADKLFHERAKAASKSKTAKEENKGETATPITEPKATPGSGKVSVDVRAAHSERYEPKTPSLQDYASIGAAYRKSQGL